MRISILSGFLPALFTCQSLLLVSVASTHVPLPSQGASSDLLLARQLHHRRNHFATRGHHGHFVARGNSHTGDSTTSVLPVDEYKPGTTDMPMPVVVDDTKTSPTKNQNILQQVQASVGVSDNCTDEIEIGGNQGQEVNTEPDVVPSTLDTTTSAPPPVKKEKSETESTTYPMTPKKNKKNGKEALPADEGTTTHQQHGDSLHDDHKIKHSHKDSNADSDDTDGDKKPETHAHSHANGKGGHLKGSFKGKCPDPRSSDVRPNGDIKFLNCGIEDEGWNPPHVTLDMLIMAEAGDVCEGQFKPCRQHIEQFKRASEETDIPTTFLMAIAMQESHCNAQLHGPNGEIGIMQLVDENCKGNCWDVENNIKLGAMLFKQYVKQNNGNVLAGIGCYNGWRTGMTKSQAMSTKYGCEAQNNLDYIDSMVNGWLQGKDGYGKEFQTYNNLARCH